MKENKLKHAIILGLISTSLRASEESKVNTDLVQYPDIQKVEKKSSLKNINRMVTIQGLERWVTEDKAINDLDLEPIKYKILSEDGPQGITLKQLDIIGEKYRAFLYLSKKYPNKQIVPNKEVDMFWHAHILDTYKYKEDCEKIFGSFFHHYPYFGMKDKDDEENLEKSFNESNELYRKEFPSKISTKMIDNRALCIGEVRDSKALCIGEVRDSKEQQEIGKNEIFANRGRPRFDRENETVIFH